MKQSGVHARQTMTTEQHGNFEHRVADSPIQPGFITRPWPGALLFVYMSIIKDVSEKLFQIKDQTGNPALVSCRIELELRSDDNVIVVFEFYHHDCGFAGAAPSLNEAYENLMKSYCKGLEKKHQSLQKELERCEELMANYNEQPRPAVEQQK